MTTENGANATDTNLARKLMREDEEEQYDAYVAMGEVDVDEVLEALSSAGANTERETQ